MGTVRSQADTPQNLANSSLDISDIPQLDGNLLELGGDSANLQPRKSTFVDPTGPSTSKKLPKIDYMRMFSDLKRNRELLKEINEKSFKPKAKLDKIRMVEDAIKAIDDAIEKAEDEAYTEENLMKLAIVEKGTEKHSKPFGCCGLRFETLDILERHFDIDKKHFDTFLPEIGKGQIDDSDWTSSLSLRKKKKKAKKGEKKKKLYRGKPIPKGKKVCERANIDHMGYCVSERFLVTEDEDSSD